MGMKQKKKKAERQRKRMRRPARLADARPWLATHQGADVLHDYQLWYSVDPLCAVAELRLLGVPISEEREAQVREDVEQRAKAGGGESGETGRGGPPDLLGRGPHRLADRARRDR